MEEFCAVAEPPDFSHSWKQVGVDVFDADHLFEAEASVGASNAAGFHAAVRSFADAETGDDVIDHDCAGVDAACQLFAAPAVPRPAAGGEAEVGAVTSAEKAQRSGIVEWNVNGGL